MSALKGADVRIVGSYPMAVDVMLCYVHVAYVHMRRSTLLVWYSRATFGTAPWATQ